MAKSVFGAPVGWYDATPLGRIFNRFSSDIITLDKDLMNDISSYSDMVMISSGLDRGVRVADIISPTCCLLPLSLVEGFP